MAEPFARAFRHGTGVRVDPPGWTSPAERHDGEAVAALVIGDEGKVYGDKAMGQAGTAHSSNGSGWAVR